MVIRASLIVVLLVGCGSSENTKAADAGEMLMLDASASDAAVESEFGSISGDCAVLDSELLSPSPDFFRLAIEFDRIFTDSDQGLLSAGGQEILADGNAGGSSVLSEVFAYELLQRCESAALLKTETEIQYDQAGKITDFLAEIASEKIGVSVTRAVAFPFDAIYPVSQAEELLSGKLADILMSSANVSATDRWRKQLLAILAYGPEHADALDQAYAGLDVAVKADTIVFVIVTDGADDFIYCDGLCE